MKRTKLTDEEVEEFVYWHERRMKDQSFPPEIMDELRKDRNKFFKIPLDKQIP